MDSGKYVRAFGEGEATPYREGIQCTLDWYRRDDPSARPSRVPTIQTTPDQEQATRRGVRLAPLMGLVFGCHYQRLAELGFSGCVQRLRVVHYMILHEGGNEVVAVVVTLAPSEGEGLAGLGARGLEDLRV